MKFHTHNKSEFSARRTSPSLGINKRPLAVFVGLFMLLTSFNASAQRKLEYLTRGLVAVKSDAGVFLSWRIFAKDDGVSFQLFRNDTLITPSAITDVSNYEDVDGLASSIYTLQVIKKDGSTGLSSPVVVWGNGYHTVALQTPEGYTPNDCSVADLDGDGVFEIIVKMEGVSKDNSQKGITDPVYLQAYKMNGIMLWSINLGINIRAGAHYTQFMVYDLDGDGKAEVACRTAPGTKDGTDAYLSNGPAVNDDDAADYRNSDGYILEGPEYLTVFDGLTGKEKATVDYVPARGVLASWGDTYGNRMDRFLACVAYFGDKPSLVMCRGYYGRSALTAWDYSNGTLTQRWRFDTNDDGAGLLAYKGQGTHSVTVGDVDDDGKDEIMYGAMAIDDDGSPMYSLRYLHGDASHLSDLVPSSPGLEFFMPHESAGESSSNGKIPGLHVRNAATGEVLWQIPTSGDIGRGMTADISADHPGNEFWAAGGLGVYNSKGEVISSNFPPKNFASWWDGDLLREMLDGTSITKWGGGSLLFADGCSSNNGTKSTPAISGDILGDWREEVVLRTADNQSLRIYTTTIPTTHGLYTLLHDPQYRLALTWQNVAYNQPPHPGFFLGHGMEPAPMPNIVMLEPVQDLTIGITSIGSAQELGLGADVPITVHARGDISTTDPSVIVYDMGTAIDTIANAPYRIWLKGLPSGPHEFAVAAHNAAGDLVTSATVPIMIDYGYPKVLLTAPEANKLYLPNQQVSIAANAMDTNGTIDSVLFYLGGSVVAKDMEAPYQVTVDNPGVGVFQVKAVAYDNDGNSTWTDSVNVEVGVIVTIEEDQMGYCGCQNGTGSVDSNHGGFGGSGFINTENIVGVQALWAIDIPADGSYKLVWRYATTTERPGFLYIDGVAADSLAFTRTGDWFNWVGGAITVDLTAGLHRLKLEATTASGLPNIDNLRIVTQDGDLAATAADCNDDGFTAIGDAVLGGAKFSVYPIPASSGLNVVANGGTEPITSIALYGVDGAKLFSKQSINASNATVELNAIPNGVYVLGITTGQGTYLRRVSVVK